MWSLGCILGEMLLDKPIFPGPSSIQQLQLISQTLPAPTRDGLFIFTVYRRVEIIFTCIAYRYENFRWYVREQAVCAKAAREVDQHRRDSKRCPGRRRGPRQKVAGAQSTQETDGRRGPPTSICSQVSKNTQIKFPILVSPL
jgi:serine/threonine protein kinase